VDLPYASGGACGLPRLAPPFQGAGSPARLNLSKSREARNRFRPSGLLFRFRGRCPLCRSTRQAAVRYKPPCARRRTVLLERVPGFSLASSGRRAVQHLCNVCAHPPRARPVAPSAESLQTSLPPMFQTRRRPRRRAPSYASLQNSKSVCAQGMRPQSPVTASCLGPVPGRA
jgi:hypothetical protein